MQTLLLPAPPCLSRPIPRPATAPVLPWHALRWRRQRGATLVPHAVEEDGGVLSFLQTVKQNLPIVGLLSRLTAPEGGQTAGPLSYGEYCRARFESADANAFGTAVTELSRGRKLNARALLFVCWMVSQGAGLVPEDVILAASARVASRSVDLEFELYRYEEALDAARKRRTRLKAPPALPSREEAALVLEKGLRAACRMGEEVLAGEDAEYLVALLSGW